MSAATTAAHERWLPLKLGAECSNLLRPSDVASSRGIKSDAHQREQPRAPIRRFLLSAVPPRRSERFVNAEGEGD